MTEPMPGIHVGLPPVAVVLVMELLAPGWPCRVHHVRSG